MHKHKYILHRKRTVVCLSKIKPPRTSESRRTGQHRPISSINKKARKEHTGKSRTYGRKKAGTGRARGKQPTEKKNAECFVFLVPVVRAAIPQEGKSDSIAVENVSTLRTTMSKHSGPERGRSTDRSAEQRSHPGRSARFRIVRKSRLFQCLQQRHRQQQQQLLQRKQR